MTETWLVFKTVYNVILMLMHGFGREQERKGCDLMVICLYAKESIVLDSFM